jgi:two-component system CheB/CheR fusion protein
VPDAIAVDEDFESLLEYLRDHRGADFTGYKRASLMRLVNRRMQAVDIATYAGYIDCLQVEPTELQALLDALLINVTALFRDSAAWNELRETLLPSVLAQMGPDEPVRVWSAACASGEEAYSLAILLHEMLGDEAYKRRVKVYATDIDEGALALARQGRLSAEAMKPLTPAQRTTYFEPEGDGFRFRKDLRQSVIFGRHDLLRDAPISRVALLSCRNVLMYFTAETQNRVLERFPFALHEHGLLFLGKAEMLLSHSQLFTPVSLSNRVFRAHRVAKAARLTSLALGRLGRVTEAAFVAGPDAQLVLDANGGLALFNERAARELGLTREDLGRPFSELEIARRPFDLRREVASVQAGGEIVEVRDLQWARGSATHWDVRVAPLYDVGEVLGVHLSFQDVSQTHDLAERLDTAQRDLGTAHEALQRSSEELQSTVEELETTNQELQSTNEELETMNEELQSTNEELQTLNDQLRDRTLQVDEANDLLQGVLEGLDVAIAVIDPEYRVQLWNVGAERLTGLRAFEAEGLLLLDIELGLPVDELHTVLRKVLAGEVPQDVVRGAVSNRFGQEVQRTITATTLKGSRTEVRGAVLKLVDVVGHTPTALNPPST